MKGDNGYYEELMTETMGIMQNEWSDNGYYTEWMKETMGIIENEWVRRWVLYRMNERCNGYFDGYYRMNERDRMNEWETMGIMQN